jgi:hypothetical protein
VSEVESRDFSLSTDLISINQHLLELLPGPNPNPNHNPNTNPKPYPNLSLCN